MFTCFARPFLAYEKQPQQQPFSRTPLSALFFLQLQRTLKVRAEFEYTLLLVLAIHVVYMYYLDHTLLVFLIRASQLIRVSSVIYLLLLFSSRSWFQPSL